MVAVPDAGLETEGRRLLNLKLGPVGPHSQRWLADQVGLGQSSISHWARGLSRPEPHLRTCLFLLWQIPESAWLTEDEQAVIDRVRASIAPVKVLPKKRPTRRPPAAA